MRRSKIFIWGDFNATTGGGRAMMCEARKFVFLVFAFLILTASASVSAAKTIYVPDDYAKIQWAVDNATAGDTIIIRDGTYYENIVVNKKLTIKSENGSAFTKIDGNRSGNVIEIYYDSVKIEGLTITGGGSGIKVKYGSLTIINNNISYNSGSGIYGDFSSNNLISNNNITYNEYGIDLGWYSSNNLISNNSISNNSVGISLLDNNLISNNSISNNNLFGINVRSNNLIKNNKISYNRNSGLLLRGSSNKVMNNTFINDGLDVSPGSYNNEVENNSVNGRPLVYLENEEDEIVENAGQIILVRCNNIAVRNSECVNTDAGILLLEANNCSITDNIFSHNHHGIRLLNNSNNISIINNKISYNSIGISIFDSNKNSISKNNISYNGYGFYLERSNNISITNNKISYNSDGIYSYSSLNNIEMKNNTISNNENGIHHVSNSNITYNNISNNNYYGIDSDSNNNITLNNIYANKYGIGLSSSNNVALNNIYMNYWCGIALGAAVNNNVITYNNISNNSRGICLSYSRNNFIYLCNFINNTYNVAYLYSSTSTWNSTEKITYTYNGKPYTNYLGNYWDDYTGSDSNGDGIGDTPYSVDSDADYYPLMQPWGNYFVLPELEVNTWISINGIPDNRSELKYYIGDQIEIHAQVFNDTSSITGCSIMGELLQNETVYSFELYDDGKPTHADNLANDGVYSSKVIIPQLEPGNCTLRITAKKDGLQGYDELRFENLGYPDGALNVTLSIVDTTPPDLLKGDTLILIANVTYKNNPYLNATVNATIISPNYEQQNLNMAHVGNGSYQCSYIPEMEGEYIIEVFASPNITDNLTGGYAVKKIDVMNGTLSISCPSLGSYLVGEEILFSLNISSEGYPVDDCIVEANVNSSGVDEKVILHPSDIPGNYIATYIPTKNGSYTVQFNASHPFYIGASCSASFEVLAGTSELNETLQDFVSDSKKCLNQILGEMDRTTREGDDFMNFKTSHEAKLAIDVVFDVLLPLHSFKPGEIDLIEYLDQGSAEAYVMWWASKKLFEKPVGKEIVEAYLSKAVEDHSFRGYYELQQELTQNYKNELDAIIDSIVVPSMDASEQEKFIKDVQMRKHANNVLVTKAIIDGSQLHGLHTRKVIEMQEEWYHGVLDTIFWTSGFVLAGILGDGPGLFIVMSYGVYTGAKLVDDMYKLDEDQKAISLAASLMITYPSISWQIYENTKQGIIQVRGETCVPMGDILDVQQISQGHRTLVWWSEDKGYFNVKVKNTGDTEAFFKAVAIYWDEHGQAHWQDATTEDFRGIKISPGSMGNLKVYWHNENIDIRPKIGENVLILLFAYTKGGIYVLDAKSFDFSPVEVEGNSASATLMAEDCELAFSNPINVFVASEVNSSNYTVVIDIRNPLPVAVSANVSQQIADNVTVPGFNNSMRWFRQISPHDRISFNYTLIPIGEVGENIVIPPASFCFYSPQHNETACFVSNTINITVKPKLYGYGSAERYLYNDSINYLNVSLTNFDQADVDTNVTIKLTDINGTLKFNQSYNVTIPANSTQNYIFTFTPVLDYEQLAMEVDTYYNGFRIPLIRDYVMVAPFTTLDVGVTSYVTVEDPIYIEAFLPPGYDYNNSIVLAVDILDSTPDNLSDDAYSDIIVNVGELDIETCKVFKTGTGFLPEVEDVTALPTVSGEPAFSRDIINGTVTIRLYVGDPILGVIPAPKSPVANFTYSPLKPMVNEVVKFNASFSYDPDGCITNYTWDFGDGNVTTTDQPVITHVYSSAGNYTVTLTVTDNDGLTNSTTKVVVVTPPITPTPTPTPTPSPTPSPTPTPTPVQIFDTGRPDNPYPSISGEFIGTIRTNTKIIATKLYTYACEGTGGHTEYALIYNKTWCSYAEWVDYRGDWMNISFNRTVVLMPYETYNITIVTGSYPQIHHTSSLKTENGWINCTEFTDANGNKYNDWIPAIMLWS